MDSKLDVISHLPHLINHPTQLAVATKNWALIEQAFTDAGIGDKYNLAWVCATVRVETASRFAPIDEFGTAAYFETMYWRNLGRRKALGNLRPEDGAMYHGRGFVQLTGRFNYGQAQKMSGAPLLKQPDLAKDPALATRILLWYWQSHKIDKVCESLAKTADPQSHALLWQTVRKKVQGGLSGFDVFMSTLKTLGVS